MRARRVQAVTGVLLWSLVAVAGCAGRSDVSRTAAPGDAEQTVSGSAMPAADRAGGQDGAMVARPSPRDYVAVPELADIHFDFDRYDIRADAARVLEASAAWLKAHPTYLVLVEGHADERGTNEYNLALGERRARASMNYLVSHGVAASRFTIISYGEERGLCSEPTEACWAKNRRAHFAVKLR